VHVLQRKMAMKSVLVYDPCILKVVNSNISSIVVLHVDPGEGEWEAHSLTSAIVVSENNKTPITKLNTRQRDHDLCMYV